MMSRPPTSEGRRQLLRAAALAVIPLHTGSLPAGGAQEIRAVLARFREAYEALDTHRFEALLAEDIRFEDPTFNLRATGIAEMRDLIAHSAAGLSSVKIVVERELVFPPWAIVQQRMTMVVSKPGVSGSRTVSVRGISVFRIEGGRLREWTDYFDSAGYQRQLAATAGVGGRS